MVLWWKDVQNGHCLSKVVLLNAQLFFIHEDKYILSDSHAMFKYA